MPLEAEACRSVAAAVAPVRDFGTISQNLIRNMLFGCRQTLGTDQVPVMRRLADSAAIAEFVSS